MVLRRVGTSRRSSSSCQQWSTLSSLFSYFMGEPRLLIGGKRTIGLLIVVVVVIAVVGVVVVVVGGVIGATNENDDEKEDEDDTNEWDGNGDDIDFDWAI